jgi:hypothetical protein
MISKKGGGGFFWKILIGRLRRRLKDKLKVRFKETSSEDVKLIDLAQKLVR